MGPISWTRSRGPKIVDASDLRRKRNQSDASDWFRLRLGVVARVGFRSSVFGLQALGFGLLSLVFGLWSSAWISDWTCSMLEPEWLRLNGLSSFDGNKT